MMKISELFRRKAAAEAALEDPILMAAFDAARDRALSVIERSPLKESETRELAYQRLKALEAVKHELAVFINEHTTEKARLDREARREAGTEI